MCEGRPRRWAGSRVALGQDFALRWGSWEFVDQVPGESALGMSWVEKGDWAGPGSFRRAWQAPPAGAPL